MKTRRAQNNYSVYAVLGVLNCCLIFTLALVLYPKPLDAVMAVGPTEAAVFQVGQVPTLRFAKQGVPMRVAVPSVAIDLAVKPGSYEPERRQWTLDDHSAFYADRTVPANTSNGTTLIYGHSTWPVFGKIADIGAGATAQVYTDTGLTFTYVYQSSRQVLPSDVSALTSSGAPTLLLQTCSGAFDAYRTLVAFRLVGVEHE